MHNPGRIVKSGERDAAIVKEVKLRLNEVLGLVGEVQNGSIGKIVKQRIQAKFCELPEGAAPEEKEVVRMTIIATVRAEAANPQWSGTSAPGSSAAPTAAAASTASSTACRTGSVSGSPVTRPDMS